MAIAIVTAAIYALLVTCLPMISFYIVQVRIADAIIMLAAIYGYPVAVGTAIGCFIANYISAPWGITGLIILDAALGSIANFIASMVVWKLRKNLAIAAVAASLIIGAIVGTYLSYILKIAFSVELPVYLSVASVTAGELVSILAFGVPLCLAIKKRVGYK